MIGFQSSWRKYIKCDMLHKIHNIYNSDPLELIRRSDVISFDVFDTAIVRPFLHHSDMYYIVEELLKFRDFRKIRLKNEELVRNNLIHQTRAKGEITLLDIYEHIYIDKQNAINTELAFDVEICRRRAFIHNLYLYALSEGKKVIFITDITYSKAVIQKILHKNGYKNYDALYVSSEENLSKQSGEIYRKVIQDMRVPPHKILHIGDSITADIQVANKYRITPLLVERDVHLMEKMINFEQYKIRDSILNSCLFAVSANVAFNDPKSNIQKSHIITMPIMYRIVNASLLTEDKIFLINKRTQNPLYRIFEAIHFCLVEENINSFTVDIYLLYAAYISNHKDLTYIQSIVSDEDFKDFGLNVYGIDLHNNDDVMQKWDIIEITSLKIKKGIIEKFGAIAEYSVYNFTMDANVKFFLEVILGTKIKVWHSIEGLVYNETKKQVRWSIFDIFAWKKLHIEILSISINDVEKYFLPQVQYFFHTFKKYLYILQNLEDKRK